MSSLPPITQGQMALDPENQIIYYRDSSNELKAVTLKWIQDSASSIENTDSISINGDLVIGGNLTVNGTTVTLNAETMYVEDNIIILNYGYTGAPILDAGIEVERGSSTNVRLRWNENTNVWELTNDGSLYDQIATLNDVGVETSYAVQGGTSGTQPTFNGAPLFSATYVKMSSNLVHFQIQVDMDNITNFGTGQYYMTLPFPSKYGYKFRDGCLHDASDGKTYHISAHVYAGSDEITLYTTDLSGQNLYDFAFAQGEPITLNSADNFHIAGTYIADI